MTQERINEIRSRCEAATPGQWRTPPSFSGVTSQRFGDVCLRPSSYTPFNDNNMIFISHAREDVPALLDYIAELERKEDRVCSVVYKMDSHLNVIATCSACGDICVASGNHEYCPSCGARIVEVTS